MVPELGTDTTGAYDFEISQTSSKLPSFFPRKTKCTPASPRNQFWVRRTARVKWQAKEGHGSAARVFTKEWGFPNHSFSIQINEKPVAPPLDIPSRHPNRTGACSLRSVVMTTVETAHFLKNYKTENQNAGFLNELGKGRAREKTTVLWVIYFI